MQYRYRLAGSNERKSATQQSSNANAHKNDTLIYINLLDKCTQILREDRIWIRNQLKSGDEELFKIFKEAKRPLSITPLNLDLQHLQIRLRKHVTAVKSKAKMEQLLKFKENMHLGDWQHKEDNYVEKVLQNKGSKYQLSEVAKNSSSEHKEWRGKSNSSLEKPKTNMYQQRGASVNTKKNPESYQVPMEQITERDSENMTSARHKAFSDENENYAFSHVYNKWKRPEENTFQLNGSNYINDSFKNKFNQTSNFNHLFTNEFGKQKNIQSPFAEMNAQPMHQREERVQPKIEESLDMPFGEPFEQSNEYGNYTQTNGISYLEDYSPNQIKEKTEPQHSHSHSRSNHSHSSFLDNLNQSGKKCEENVKTIEEIERESLSSKKYENESYKTDSFDETNLMQSKNNTIHLSNDINNESLFTSPELLAECRNFLKMKSSAKPSAEKENTNNKFFMDINSSFEPLKFDFKEPTKKNEKDAYDYSNSITQAFPLIKTDMTESISQLHEFQFENKPNYSAEISKITREATNKNLSLPREEQTRPSLQRDQAPRESFARESFTKELLPKEITKEHTTKEIHHYVEPSNSVNNGSYEYFHTFSGLSTHKKVEPSLASPEEFLDQVFEALSNENEGYIYWNSLENLVHQKCPKYLDSFRQYLYPSEGDELVLISNIGRLLEDLMSEENIQPAENDSRTICRLLDIEQKGFINEQDIEDFIRQLEDSEAEDIEMISQYLWRLFENIDKDAEDTGEKRIDYWGIYSKKNSSDFEELNEILKQFEFQIE